jgi:hypothetical protein
MNRRNFIWYLFALFLIGAGSLAVFGGGDVRDGYQLIALGGILAVILTLTGGHSDVRK